MLLERYLPRIEFDSYEDFKQNYQVNVPDNFNFAYDIVDEWAKLDNTKKALVWCDDHGSEREFTFEELRRLSNQAAHFFMDHGIGKGDVVMLILRRRFEYWICALALCKIGATLIPATLQLTPKDIIYRCNAAEVKMVVCVDDAQVLDHVEQSLPKTKTLQAKAVVAGSREGWLDFTTEIAKYPDELKRPALVNKTMILC